MGEESYDAAYRRYEAAKDELVSELLFRIGDKVRAEYPDAKSIMALGEYAEDFSGMTVRLQQVLGAGGAVLADVNSDPIDEDLEGLTNGNVDDDLGFLGYLTGEDYLGDEEIDLWDDADRRARDAQDGTTVVVGGNGYWGSGATLQEAKKRFQREGGKLANGYEVITFEPGSEFCGVDGMGRYSWKGTAPTTQEVPARGRK